MKEKKCSFLKKIAYTFNPSAYSILSFQKVGAVIGFVMLFTLITVGIQFADFYLTFQNAMYDSAKTDSVEEWMNASIPEFTLKNGKLQMDEVVDISVEGMVIYIDDSLEEVTMSDMDYLSKNSAFDIFMLGSRSNLLLYQVKEHKYKEIRFSDYGNVITNKAEVVKFVANAFQIGIVLMFVVWYLLAVCIHFIIALFYFIIFLILNAFLKRKADAVHIYTTCVFAIVPYHIVKLVLGLLSITLINELVQPLYFISVLVLGGFALYSVHEENMRQDGARMNSYRPGDDYLYVSVNATAMGDDAFGGYSSLDGQSGQKGLAYKNNKGYDRRINLKGVLVNKSKLEIADRYVQGNLKEMAVSNLQSLTGLSAEECLDIVYNWYQYYY